MCEFSQDLTGPNKTHPNTSTTCSPQLSIKHQQKMTLPDFLNLITMMKCAVVLLALVAVALCEDYEQVLQSPGALMALFSSFSAKHHKHYTLGEAPMRIRLFRNSLKSVVQGNKLVYHLTLRTIF